MIVKLKNHRDMVDYHWDAVLQPPSMLYANDQQAAPECSCAPIQWTV